MSELGDKRRLFSQMVVRLCLQAELLGYDYSFDMVKRCSNCPVGHPNSTHKFGLAIDLNLYHFGEYIRDGSGHKELHEFWEFLGGSEKVVFDSGNVDWNHYSLEWNGVR